MTAVLWVAAAYNIVWGTVVILFPRATLDLLRLPAPQTLQLWQCIGMIVGVYGVGYALAARDPLTRWPLVLVGLLGKVLGPIGFLDAAVRGEFPWSAGWMIVTNDLIWWIPFALILWRAREAAVDETTRPLSAALEQADPPASLDAVDHLAISVSDVSGAVDWYRERFRCRVKYQDATWALVEFANTRLAFVIAVQHPPHLAFTHPAPEEYAPLKQHRDGTRSCYIHDPSGNVVELMAAAAGRG